MSPERRPSSSDGASSVKDQYNVIASTTPNQFAHVLQATPSRHPVNSHQQQPSMNVVQHTVATAAHNNHHYPSSLQHQHHQQLQQNGVSVTSVHSEASNGHPNGLAVITTSYNNFAPNDNYSTVVSPPSAHTTTTTTMAMNTTASGSKLLVLQPSQLNDSIKHSK